MIAGNLTHLWLGHVSERKAGAAELLLGETKQEIGLILGGIGSPLQQPAIALTVKLTTRIVPGGQQICPNLARRHQQLIELQVIVAEAAWNGRASGKIFLHKGTHHVILETILVVDHVVRDTEVLGDTAGIVNVIDGAAASLHLLRHSLMARQAALVPELHGQPHHVITLGAQHGRDGGRIHTAGHSYGNGLSWHESVPAGEGYLLIIEKCTIPRDPSLKNGCYPAREAKAAEMVTKKSLDEFHRMGVTLHSR